MNFWPWRRSRDADLDDEIRAHLNIATQYRIARGESPDAAAIAARREFGNELAIKEVTRQMWGWNFLERFARDLNYAFRQLRRSPGFAAVIVLSLALGIGANSAIFSILNALLLRPLPVRAPGELFILRQQSQRTVPQRFSYPMFLRLRDSGSGAKAVAAMTRVNDLQITLGEGAQPERTPAQLVSGEFFSTLGVSPALGRTLIPTDRAAAVISYGFWQRRFARSADALGRKIRLNGVVFTIVGVAPEGFRGVWLESPTNVWIPLVMQSDIHYVQNYSDHNGSDPEKPWVPQEFIDWLDIVVRANPASVSATRDALNGTLLRSEESITGNLGPEARRFFLERSLALDPFAQGLSNLRQRFTSPLIAMMAMVALVLLIACANAANLLLARAEGRQREIAVRLSIGASRARLIQQLLTESFVLVAAAAALGLLLAQWSSDLLVRMALGATRAPFLAGIDRRVLLFTIALSIATGFLFGLAPAFRATGIELASAMKAVSRNVAGRSRLTPAKFLVAAQIALSLVVVFGAGLFARSLRNLAHADLGFDREHVLTVWMDPRSAGFNAGQLPGLYHRLIESMEAVPGVRSAAVSMCGLAVECRSTTDFKISGYVPAPLEDVRVQFSYVSSDYLSTVGMRLLEGRDFDARDQGHPVAIVNEAFVRRYLANRNPIGQHFGETLESEIVGVIEDARVNRVREAAVPMAYYPIEGEPIYAESLEIRAAGDPQTIAADVRKALAQTAGNLPIPRITTLTQQVDRSLNQDRMIAILATVFGFLALGLGCFGLYGVMSYAVTKRTSEIGVRMALGAQPSNVLWAVLREAFGLIVLGLAVGLPAAIFGSRWISASLFGLKPDDPLTLAAASCILIAVAIAASLIPARRASRVDPCVALRNE
jgi:predicted permease